MSVLQAPAEAAINTLIYLGTDASPSVFSDPIARVGDITGPTMGTTVVDVTSQSTTGGWRQKIGTLKDPGELSFPLYFIPDNAGDQALLDLFADNPPQLRSYKILFPDNTYWLFEAYLTKFSMKAPVAGVLTADVTLTLTGAPQFNL